MKYCCEEFELKFSRGEIFEYRDDEFYFDFDNLAAIEDEDTIKIKFCPYCGKELKSGNE